MVAGVVEALGVPLSLWWNSEHKKEYEYHEDERINAALQSGDDGTFARIIVINNATHAVWGYKHIFGLTRLNRTTPFLRNPHYLVTTRGLAAIVQRQRIHRQDVTWQRLWCEESWGTRHVIEFVAHCRQPMWVGSFDRMVCNPVGLAREIAAFCGITADDERIQLAASTVKHPCNPA